MKIPTRAPRPTPTPSWPPSDDRRVWTWVFGSYGPSLVAWGLGVPFWVPGFGPEAYQGTSPLVWMSVMPLLGLALATRRSAPFQVTVWLQLVVGIGLMLSLLQLPRAMFAVGEPYSGLEDVSYHELMLSFGLAFAAGAVALGGGAYLLRLKLGVDAARARAR